MKKIITVVAFFAITLFSINTAVAQDLSIKNSNTNAKTFSQELSQRFNLDKDQQRAIYNAHMLKERKKNALNNYNAADKRKKAAKENDINSAFDAKLKEVLTAEQFKKYSTQKKHSARKKHSVRKK